MIVFSLFIYSLNFLSLLVIFFKGTLEQLMFWDKLEMTLRYKAFIIDASN